ncbi:hypothetical protein D1872_319210 [compost metagenome]
MLSIHKRHFDAYRTLDVSIAFVYGKRLVCHNRFVAWEEKCPGDQCDDFVRTAAKNQMVARNAEMFGERARQLRRAAIRVNANVCKFILNRFNRGR